MLWHKTASNWKRVYAIAVILNINTSTKNNLLSLFARFEFDTPFTHADVTKICNLAPSSAGKMMDKLKEMGLIESAAE